jgi:hypothetical protein
MGNEIAGIKIPKPQSNSYASSSAAVSGATQAQAVTTSHNTFRPDIYRVSEGYLT